MGLRVINTKLVEQEMMTFLLQVELEEIEKILPRSYIIIIRATS